MNVYAINYTIITPNGSAFNLIDRMPATCRKDALARLQQKVDNGFGAPLQLVIRSATKAD